MKIKSAVFVTSAVKPQQYPDGERAEIAFIGRSNVGKSSLINSLVNRKKLAKISQTPGKTRLINFFLINDSFFFADLPGFGYARVPLDVRRGWQKMLESYFNERANLYGICWLFDIRREPAELDYQTLEWLDASGLPYRLIFTKSDKLSRSRAKNAAIKLAASLGVAEYQTYSTVKREGKDDLWQWINEVVSDDNECEIND